MNPAIQFISPAPKELDEVIGAGLEPYFDNAQPGHFWIQARFRLVRKIAKSLFIDFSQGRLFEVGCGNGHLQSMMKDDFGVVLEVSDMNIGALKIAARQNIGPVYYYDVLQEAAQFQKQFSVIFLLDVLEHIKDPTAFLISVSHLLTPGGKLIINVPARQELFSPYDVANGHYRRYSVETLKAECGQAGARIVWMQYWGMVFYPILCVRKWLLHDKKPTQAALDQGFRMPHPVVNALMLFASIVERKIFRKPAIGTSVLAVCEFP